MADGKSSHSSEEPSQDLAVEDGGLHEFEVFWRNSSKFLLSRGYRLRERYQPNWVPSWYDTKKPFILSSDGLMPRHPAVVDARRVSDGERLMLKRVSKSLHPHEAEIGQFFSSEPVSKEQHNHCVPIYEVLQSPTDPDLIILVMPMLRRHDDPGFDTIGEAVEFLRQVFEGLQFMHKQHVAHRDVALYNILMDARSLYIDEYHPSRPSHKLNLRGPPRHHTRTQRPVKYYLTDFGLSRRYKPEDLPVLEDVIVGADKTVPEFRTGRPCDPFPTDIYTLGSMIREEFTEGSRFIKAKYGFDFLKPLVTDMTQSEPSSRPTIDQVVERFEEVRNTLSTWTLRSRVVQVNESYASRVFLGIGHWSRKIRFVIGRVPPVPRPT